MTTKRLTDVKVLGVHPVEPTEAELMDALEWQWGPDLRGRKLKEAKQRVREHFDGLCLVEVQLIPHDAEVQWSEFTQPVKGKPRSDWQAPCDELPLDEGAGRWTFFLHFVDLSRPLQTPVGLRPWPKPTLIPHHLKAIRYECP